MKIQSFLFLSFLLSACALTSVKAPSAAQINQNNLQAQNHVSNALDAKDQIYKLIKENEKLDYK